MTAPIEWLDDGAVEDAAHEAVLDLGPRDRPNGPTARLRSLARHPRSGAALSFALIAVLICGPAVTTFRKSAGPPVHQPADPASCSAKVASSRWEPIAGGGGAIETAPILRTCLPDDVGFSPLIDRTGSRLAQTVH